MSAHELTKTATGPHTKTVKEAQVHYIEHFPEASLANEAQRPEDFLVKRAAAHRGYLGFTQELVDRLELAARATYPELWRKWDEEHPTA